jgi:hypothetical protein
MFFELKTPKSCQKIRDFPYWSLLTEVANMARVKLTERTIAKLKWPDRFFVPDALRD